MPYITQRRKEELAQRRRVFTGGMWSDPSAWTTESVSPHDAGDLTYLLYRECIRQWAAEGGPSLLGHINAFLPEQPRYADFAVVLDSLSATRYELKRRKRRGWRQAVAVVDGVERSFYDDVVAPYENTKIEQNGDVT